MVRLLEADIFLSNLDAFPGEYVPALLFGQSSGSTKGQTPPPKIQGTQHKWREQKTNQKPPPQPRPPQKKWPA